jgi:hypothetical protein
MFIVQIDMLDLYSNMQSNDHNIKIIQSIIQNKWMTKYNFEDHAILDCTPYKLLRKQEGVVSYI